MEERGSRDELVNEDELVAEDDAIIGIAFRRSLLVLGLVAALGGAVYWLTSGSQTVAPEQRLDATAPTAVVAPAVAPAVPFADVTAAAGINFVHENGAYGDKLLPETMGGGVAFFDADGNGTEDLLFVNSSRWPHRPKTGKDAAMALYLGDGQGSFRDATASWGLDLSFYGMGVAVADYDGDGDTDLFLTAVGRNRLLRNEGGRFRDVTEEAGVGGGDAEWSSSAGFVDVDNDGDLDLLVCNYVRWSKEIDFELDFRLTGVGRAFGPPQNYEGTYPYLYRNEGDGTFVDVSAAAGLHVDNLATGLPMAKSLALGPADVDGDGWIDILVANDTVRNFFFRNLGDGTFEEVGEEYGFAYDRDGNATGAMGVDSAYYRNGPNLGFMIGNFANEMSSLYVAQDDPAFFVDEAIGEGIGAPSRRMLTFGLLLLDADLDGRVDLLQANGHIEDEIAKVDSSQSYRQAGQLFWNGGADGFLPVPLEDTGGLATEIVGRGATYADIDSDGDLDVVLTQIAGPPLVLRNDQALDHHWLRVRLQGKPPNTDAIGAWVEVTAGGVTQRRQVMPTRSYLSQVERTLTFGLGTEEKVDELRIAWPDGSEQAVGSVEAGQLVVIEQ